MKKINEAKSSAEKLYNTLFKMREQMQEIANMAQELASDAAEYGGEISRVLREQCINYLIPTLGGLVSDENQPGAIEPMIEFLDSCPLAFIREEPQAPQGPTPVAPNGAILATPAGSKGEEIPQNASFNTIEDEGPAETAVQNLPDDMRRNFESAYKKRCKEDSFMEGLFREEDEEMDAEDDSLEEANIFTQAGRAQIQANRTQKAIDKTTAKVKALTAKWTTQDPRPYWKWVLADDKTALLNKAKRAYYNEYIKRVNREDLLDTQNTPNVNL